MSSSFRWRNACFPAYGVICAGTAETGIPTTLCGVLTGFWVTLDGISFFLKHQLFIALSQDCILRAVVRQSKPVVTEHLDYGIHACYQEDRRGLPQDVF